MQEQAADGDARGGETGDKTGGSRWLALGMGLWVLALVARWPVALSFADEVGYVGQAKLFLEGHVRPLADSPGMWVKTPEGSRAQYPLLVPLLLAPLFALAPRLVFASGVAAALALAVVAGRALRAWGRSPLWALVVLAHPTVSLMARTAMADLPLAAFSVGAWWAVRRDRHAAAVLLLALTIAAKPLGPLIALAIVVGEAGRLLPDLRARDRAATARVAWAAAGLVAGGVLLVASNLIASGRLWFSYDFRFLGTPPFWFKYLRTTAPVQMRSLLLLPPLLVAGVWPFWRRRDYGPVLVIGGLTLLMFSYFFVDRGRSWPETLVLAPRLMMPVVAFLLIGYADLLAGLVVRWPRLARLARGGLVVAPAAVALAISVGHRRWQEPMGAALATASRLVAELGENELGITGNCSKSGVLYPGHTAWAPIPHHQAPRVVLCSTASWSYRAADGPVSCQLPGYEDRSQRDGFHFLVRQRP